MISNKDKIRQRDLPGDLVSLAVENCVIMRRWPHRPWRGPRAGEVDAMWVPCDSKPTGPRPPPARCMIADFHFLDNALESMAAEILAYPDQKQVDITKTYYEKMLREVLGLERSDKLISELSIKGEIKKLPDELVKPLVLGDVKMRVERTGAKLVERGPDRPRARILKKPVYRYVKGKIHLERKRSGDIMTILLMLDDQTYYFFQYTRNYLYAYSSDAAIQHHVERSEGRQATAGGEEGRSALPVHPDEQEERRTTSANDSDFEPWTSLGCTA